MPRVLFRDWRPDLPRLLNPGLILAKNCVPTTGGFGPMPSYADGGFNALTETPPTVAFCRGAFGKIDLARNPYNFAGSATKLWLIKSTASDLVDVTRAGGPYGCTGTRRWSFADFDEYVIAANPSDTLQSFRVGHDTQFQDVVTAPRFAHVASISPGFLLGGNYFDSINGGVPNGIAWSGIGDPLYWPTPGSDEALAAQSDRQGLEGGGHIQGVVGGVEIGVIFGESSIWRLDYRGGPEVFQVTRVERDKGLLYPGLAVSFGRAILHLSEDGWKVFDYTQSSPAGKGRFDSFFFADFDQANANRVSAIQDPDSTRIWISYPGAGNTGGLPNKLLVYDWALDRFSHGEEAIEQLVRFVTPSSGSLDDPPLENIDATTGSFDDAISAAGPFRLGAWDGNHKLGSFTGANKNATFESGDIEIAPGRRAMLTEAWPLIRGSASTTFRVAALREARQSDDVGGAVPWGASLTLDSFGKFNPRVDGRYHRLETTVQGAGFVEAIGLDLVAIARGRR